jgi:hypothetical protein
MARGTCDFQMKTAIQPTPAAPVLIQLPWRLDVPANPQSNVIVIRGKPHRWRKYSRDVGDQVASVVWSGGNSAAGPHHYPREVALAHAHLLFAAPDLLVAAIAAEAAALECMNEAHRLNERAHRTIFSPKAFKLLDAAARAARAARETAEGRT